MPCQETKEPAQEMSTFERLKKNKPYCIYWAVCAEIRVARHCDAAGSLPELAAKARATLSELARV